ncbi:hypothetical protein WN944_006866 [Citrus x changshan-huyou]|uniref:Uncharacterized protein n=1 Tax=Citrus x changshan-huyou TaxID=2935761 RepID=A0AAP0MPS0_9ROSI
MIANLFKPGYETEDYGIMSNTLTLSMFMYIVAYWLNLFVPNFRDGACKFLDEKWSPKFTVIVTQNNHHTKFFQSGRPENVPPVAPISYAHLAAAHMSQFNKFDEMSNTSSSHSNVTSASRVPVLEPPVPHRTTLYSSAKHLKTAAARRMQR